jgi:hypothetical protein
MDGEVMTRPTRRLARFLRGVATRLRKWAKSRPQLEYCPHPNVEPAGTADFVRERIQDGIKRAITYTADLEFRPVSFHNVTSSTTHLRWGFRRALSQLRLEGHQNVAGAAERAVNDLLGAVDQEAQKASRRSSNHIPYDPIVKQAQLTATQIDDAAAMLEKEAQAKANPPKSRRATKPGKRRGRRPLGDKEKQKRWGFVQGWTDARDSGVSKDEFCEDRDVDVAYLDKCLDWARRQSTSTR